MSDLEQVEADIRSLPEEAQALLIDFIGILKKRYGQSATKPGVIKTETQRQNAQNGEAQQPSSETTHRTLDLTNSAFVGMWKERSDMRDSTDWVRQQRQQQWRT